MVLDNAVSSAGAVVTQYPHSKETQISSGRNQAGNGLLPIVCRTSGMALDNSGSPPTAETVRQWTHSRANTNQQAVSWADIVRNGAVRTTTLAAREWAIALAPPRLRNSYRATA